MFLSLKSIELSGFKSFGKKTELVFGAPIASIVGPNGSGKSNVAEGFRFVLGEQSMKSMRSKRGEDLIWGGSPSLPRMNRAGVKVVFGTDAGVFMHGKNAKEFEFMVEGGMPAMEAIKAATMIPAEILGEKANMGSLETGKYADIIASDENPLKKYQNPTKHYICDERWGDL